MSDSLRERYEAKRSKNLLAEAVLLREREEICHQILIEALEPGDLKQATTVIKSLKTLKGKGIDSLDKAIDEMINDVQKFAGEGIGSKLLRFLGRKLSLGIAGAFLNKNPMMQALAMADALKQGFKQLPDVLGNFIDEEEMKKNKDKTLQDLVEADKLKTLGKTLYKAFTPKGIFSRQKGISHLNEADFIRDITTSATIEQLSVLTKTADQIPDGEAAATALEAAAKEGTAGETSGTAEESSAADKEKNRKLEDEVSRATSGMDGGASLRNAIAWLRRNGKLKD